ncbi:MAG: VOC family protein [Bryobacterales bacterium]|nr:VOC family protein [Bryobacterales bacterium]
MDRIGLKRMHHVSFAVANLDASKRFFCEVLGLPEDDRPDFGFPGAWLAVGDRQIHLIEQAGAGRETPSQISRSDHLAMEVSDLNAVKARLSACGVEFVEGGNERLGMSQAFCSDPDGHTIEFVQYH